MSGKTKFRCWAPDDCDEEDAREVEAWDAEDAAKEHGEHRYSDSDYPGQQQISMRAPNGTLTQWTVSAQQDVHFTVREAKS
jgi:hypothetical protein